MPKTTRRAVLRASFASSVLLFDSRSVSGVPPADRGSITEVAGVKVGHFTDPRRPTGCTVIVFESGAVGGVDVRGAAPGTRETDLLDPRNLVQQVHAVVLAGGSAFGLDTASGVMRHLEERNIGYPVPAGRVPIVPAAVLYDLELGDSRIRPDAEAGYKAAKAASSEAPAEGSVGVGAGAVVGKLFGRDRAMKGGVGTASIRMPDGLTVGALVAVNAAGDIIDPATGQIVAGARTSDGKGLEGTMAALLRGEIPATLLGATNTTIGVVATDATLDKAQVSQVARAAHDGLARTINPAHTIFDGDTMFAVATGLRGSASAANLTLIGALAAEAVARAVIRAVRAAKGVHGIPAISEMKG